ncbi:MAG: hypothetical protein RID42_07375 [Alphaproteobacteria bacterium]
MNNGPGQALPPASLSSDFIDLRWLAKIWLRWSWLAVLAGLVGAYFGLETVKNTTPVYKASMIVQPDAGSSSGGSAASLAIGEALGLGGDIGGGNATAFGRLQVVIGSLSLARELQREHHLMQVVFGGWDEESKQWLRPEGKKFERQQRFRRWIGLSLWSAPDEEDLASYLAGSIKFEASETPGFHEVSYRHPDPEIALRVLSIAYRAADSRTRAQDLVESVQRRNYISRQLSEVRLVDSRQALINLLTSAEREAMMLESDLPYAARIIEPEFVSSNFEEPNVVVMVGLRAAIGAGVMLLLVTMVALFRSPS